MNHKDYMRYQKKSKASYENTERIKKKAKDQALNVALSCAIVDTIPPRTENLKDFLDFLKTLRYCNEHKLYETRDLILEEIIEELRII